MATFSGGFDSSFLCGVAQETKQTIFKHPLLVAFLKEQYKKSNTKPSNLQKPRAHFFNSLFGLNAEPAALQVPCKSRALKLKVRELSGNIVAICSSRLKSFHKKTEKLHDVI